MESPAELAASKKDKFVYLYEKYYHVLFRYAKDILGTHELAEDALQETFIRIYNNLDKITVLDDNRTRNYLITITKNVSKTNHRKEEQIKTCSIELIDEHRIIENDPTWNVFYFHATIRNLRGLILQMDVIDQTILLYKIICNWSYKEIADMLGLTANNVSVRLSRARGKLKSAFLSDDNPHAQKGDDRREFK